MLANTLDVYAAAIMTEPVQACVIVTKQPLTSQTRTIIADCLGWQSFPNQNLCHGTYQPVAIPLLSDEKEIRVNADEGSFYPTGRSQLQGHVRVQQSQHIVTAQTATIYRDPTTQQVTAIELLGDVRYFEPGRVMIAKKAILNLQDKSGHIEEVLYRFSTQHAHAVLPAWGRALWIQRFANENYQLKQVTYTTCAPKDKAWQIEADEITLNHANETGIARQATLRVGDWPVFYSPYLSFPTSNARKSGFLMPMTGYSNVGGFDVAAPYYWNLASNYDATFVPHLYSRRGVMAGGDLRYLTEHSVGSIGGNFLPHDAAFNQFLINNRDQYSQLQGVSNNRWAVLLRDSTQLLPNLQMNISYQQVSDPYYLQDFSSNLAISSDNQLLRQGDLTYTTDHWLFSGLLQSYQTLHPINQSTIADIYERLPQLLAQGHYDNLPLNANFDLYGQFDYFRWTGLNGTQPQGPRYHLNPILAMPLTKPWGYITPQIQLVENNYALSASRSIINDSLQPAQSFNRLIPRYSIDTALTFERSEHLLNERYTQTLEPHLYYLKVPYQNQSQFPSFDSAYMIFNTDQLFRDNRFSGLDRIGDANQLAYALTSRWLTTDDGREKARVTVGQIRYFADRRVQLCYRLDGQCQDTPLFLGYLSPQAATSPIASKLVYELSPKWVASGDYVWDTYTRATNNSDVNLHYQPGENRIISVGYNYLADGNILALPAVSLQNRPLHQATAAIAWPLTEQWSSLGIYSYNISEGYSMTSVLGFQYDSCCWAARLLGGRTFQSLLPNALTPQYNNNVYFQILLKGLGSAANSDPASTIQTYLPGYMNIFQH